MSRKPAPITLARIAADIIDGAQLPGLKLDDAEAIKVIKPASVGKSEVALQGLICGIEFAGQTVPRSLAEALGQRIADAWGMIKAHDSTGTVDIHENAEGLWYAVWRDHAGVVIAESTPVTTAGQAGKLVAWMRENAAAAREQVIEGKFAEAQVLAATAPAPLPPDRDEDTRTLVGILHRLGAPRVGRIAALYKAQADVQSWQDAAAFNDAITRIIAGIEQPDEFGLPAGGGR